MGDVTWIVLLTFLLSGHVKQVRVECPDWHCVQEIRAHQSLPLIRLRVWRRDDYAKLPEGGTFVWPPVIDDQPI